MLLIITPTEAFFSASKQLSLQLLSEVNACLTCSDVIFHSVLICCPGVSALKIHTLSHFKLLWQAVRLFAFPLPWIKHFSLISTLELKTY